MSSTAEKCVEMLNGKDRFDILLLDSFEDGGNAGINIVKSVRSEGFRGAIIVCLGMYEENKDAFVEAGVEIVWKKPLPEMKVVKAGLRKALRSSESRQGRESP